MNQEEAWRFIAHIMSEEVQLARIPTYNILSAHRNVVLETVQMLPFAHAHVLLEIAESSLPIETTLEWYRINPIIDAALSAATQGIIPIDEAVRERIVPSVNAILAEIGAN